MTQYFYTSDYHFGHLNVLVYAHRDRFMIASDKEKYEKALASKRPRSSLKKLKLDKKSLDNMVEQIIKRHNARVSEDDIVYHLGDFCFKNTAGGKYGEGERRKANEYEELLNGKIIHVKGNHDKNNSTKTNIESMTIKAGGRRLYLTHRPQDVNFNCELNLVGHVHDKWKFARFHIMKKNKRGFYIPQNIDKDPKSREITDCINVGCDAWEFYPRTINELLTDYNRWRKELGQK